MFPVNKKTKNIKKLICPSTLIGWYFSLVWLGRIPNNPSSCFTAHNQQPYGEQTSACQGSRGHSGLGRRWSHWAERTRTGPERRAGSMGGRGLNGTATGSSGSNECPWGHPGASLGIWEDHQNSGRFREKNHWKPLRCQIENGKRWKMFHDVRRLRSL